MLFELLLPALVITDFQREIRGTKRWCGFPSWGVMLILQARGLEVSVWMLSISRSNAINIRPIYCVHSVQPTGRKVRNMMCFVVITRPCVSSGGWYTIVSGTMDRDHCISFSKCSYFIATVCIRPAPSEEHLFLMVLIKSAMSAHRVRFPTHSFVRLSKCQGPRYLSPALFDGSFFTLWPRYETSYSSTTYPV